MSHRFRGSILACLLLAGVVATPWASGPAAAQLAVPLNNAVSALGSDHPAGSGTLVLRTGEGARFGTPSPGAPIRITVADRSTLVGNQIVPGTAQTIFLVTGRTGDTLTGLSATEGTADRNYHRNDPVASLITAGTIAEVQNAVGSVDANAVKLAGDQTVAGVKTMTGTLTTVTNGATGTIKSNRHEIGTPGVAADWAVGQMKLWGYDGSAPFYLVASGPNPFNGVQDNTLVLSYNAGNGGARFNLSEPSLYFALEAHVFDAGEPFGNVTGNTHNFEWDLNQDLADGSGGQRWLQFRSRRDTLDPATGFTCWRWVINGPRGFFDVHDRAGNVLLSTDILGNVVARKSLSLGQPVTGIPGQGDISMGGAFSLGGEGTVSLSRAGLGEVWKFTGTTGTTVVSQSDDAQPAIRVRPFANDPYSAPGIAATKADGTTMSAGLGQSGVQVGSGTIKYVGSGTLSGFGGAETGVIAGVGLVTASPIHLWRAGDATTPLMQLDTTALTLAKPVVLPTVADAAIPNGGIAWSTTTADTLKVRTPSGVLKTIQFAP